ncbi:MAG: hypothetical protein WAX79_04305 [Candidatus Omnitrophota bacterium]
MRIIYIAFIVFTLALGNAAAEEAPETMELSDEDIEVIQNLEILKDLEVWENLGLLEDYEAVKEMENLESQGEVNENEESSN